MNTSNYIFVLTFILSHTTGLDCRGTRGKSFSAFMKRVIKEDMDFWHCGAHQLNLTLNDALDAIAALKLFYIPHL